jgi:hypothetical protein
MPIRKEKAPTGTNPIDAVTRLVSNQKLIGNITHFPSDLQSLAKLKASHLRAKYPNVPDHAISKGKPFKDITANGLTKCIIDAINLCGGQAERISNTGRVIDTSYTYTNVIGQMKTIGGSKYIPGTGTNGTADISAIWNGLSLKIEVKIGMDKLSPQQITYGEHIERAGGIYLVARSYSGFVEEMERRLHE